MSMQIRAIILYGRNGKRRTLDLRLNAVNVITGESRTGKTALLDIIDYCLGRGNCNVPEGVIRRAVAWYALLLQFPETQAFVARAAPAADQNTSSDAVLELGKALAVPEAAANLTVNISVSGLTDSLGRLAGITPNENVPPAGQTRLSLRASLDHAKFLVFQGQSEITNRDLLFHRQGEPFIGQSIKDTLPYFLGAVADKSLMLRAQLRDAKQELQRLERRQAEAEQIRGGGNARALALASEAMEVGLMAQEAMNSPRQSLRQLLAAPPRRTGGVGDPQIGAEALALRSELTQLRRRYQELQDQTQAATTFNDAQSLFEYEVHNQQSRLETINLFPPSGHSGDTCPLRQSALAQPVPTTDNLRASLASLRSELAEVGSRRPRVDEYINGLRSEIAQVRREMSDRRQRLDAIESQDTQFELAADLERRQAHVLGRISLYLETVPESLIDASGPRRAAELQDQIDRIEEELGDDTIKEAIDSALSRISKWMTEGAVALNLEYQPNPHRLDLTHLTVVADTEDRDVRMSQMGSAENWLGCHIVAHVALHRWFASKKRPVPRFLFIDQPTSAYYPPDSPAKATDKDRAAVARMYEWLMTSISTMRPAFQLIVVDHADLDEPWFKECIIERWRDGNALIPSDWLIDDREGNEG